MRSNDISGPCIFKGYTVVSVSTFIHTSVYVDTSSRFTLFICICWAGLSFVVIVTNTHIQAMLALSYHITD